MAAIAGEEMRFEDLEADATEDELAAEIAVRSATVAAFARKRPSRKPFPDHLPRERLVTAAPESCSCCDSRKLVKLGEDITETLEVIPRQWKVIQTVRERFSCRECETIARPPGAVPRHPARLCRAERAGEGVVLKVRAAPALEPQ
jgi:transposase